MILTAPTIEEGSRMPLRHAVEGDNVSPELSWSGAPEGTKYFAVTCYDPDAPTGSGWWHWLWVNIPADVVRLEEGASKNSSFGLETATDYGVPGYSGPLPPKGHGMHRYQFTVWALSEAVEAEASTPPAQVGFQINFKALASARVTGTFVR